MSEILSNETLRQSEEKYRLLIEQSDDVVFEWDFEADIVYFSKQYRVLTGFESRIDHFTHVEGVASRVHADDRERLIRWMNDTYKKKGRNSVELRWATTRGDYIWMHGRCTALCDDKDVPIKAFGVFSNIDKQKSMITYLKLKSQQDSLTKLYNKAETEELIRCHLRNMKQDEKTALFLIDIDNFKGVNDNLGHQFGDMVLQDVAKKIKNLFRRTDIVGRIGGDEFAVLMLGVEDNEIVCQKAEILLKLLRNTYFGDQTKYMVTGSIGIVCYPDHGNDFNGLYHCADIALYESKRKGKDCYTVFYEEIDKKAVIGRTPEESGKRFLASYYEGDLIYSIFEMLYETNKIAVTINRILEMIGQRFSVHRVYIFEHNEDLTGLSNTYEWCTEGIPSQMKTLQNIQASDLERFFSCYNQEGILLASDIRQLDEFAFQMLDRQGVKAILHCGFFDEGQLKGFIGFDDCKKNRQWRGEEIAILGYISKILSIFILKKQISKKLWNSYQNYTQMLDHLNGYVYVIDTETYKMMYVNKAVEELGATVGEKCHEMAFGRREPCENCPARRLSEETPFTKEEMYSVKVDGWVSSAASRLKWTDGKNAALICCTDITKYKCGAIPLE